MSCACKACSVRFNNRTPVENDDDVGLLRQINIADMSMCHTAEDLKKAPELSLNTSLSANHPHVVLFLWCCDRLDSELAAIFEWHNKQLTPKFLYNNEKANVF